MDEREKSYNKAKEFIDEAVQYAQNRGLDSEKLMFYLETLILEQVAALAEQYRWNNRFGWVAVVVMTMCNIILLCQLFR